MDYSSHKTKPVKTLCLLGLCLFGTTAFAASERYMLLNNTQWKTLRANPVYYQALIQHCNNEIDQKPQPVSVLDPEPRYTPTGMNKNGQQSSRKLAADSTMAYRAGLCYRLTNNARFARHAQEIIDAWANTLKAVKTEPGVETVNYRMPYLILASYWVKNAAGWHDNHWQKFLRTFVQPLSLAQKKTDNDGSWGVFLDAALAAYLNDPALLNQARNRWESLLKTQVDKDGVLVQEICRSNTNNYCGGATKGIKGIAYSHFTLLPTTMSAQIFEGQGKSVWKTPGGEALKRAYAKLAEWTQHPEKSPYYAANNGKLVQTRNGAYFALLQQHYPNAYGAEALRQGDLRMDGFRLLMMFDSDFDPDLYQY